MSLVISAFQGSFLSFYLCFKHVHQAQFAVKYHNNCSIIVDRTLFNKYL